MGLFSKPVVICGVCGKEIGSKEKRWETQDGFLCPDCQKPFGILNGPKAFIKYTTKEMKVKKEARIKTNEFWDKNKQLYDSLNVTRVIGNILHIDDTRRKWYLYLGRQIASIYENPNSALPPVFDFSEVSEIVGTSLGEYVDILINNTDKPISVHFANSHDALLAKNAFEEMINSSYQKPYNELSESLSQLATDVLKTIDMFLNGQESVESADDKISEYYLELNDTNADEIGYHDIFMAIGTISIELGKMTLGKKSDMCSVKENRNKIAKMLGEPTIEIDKGEKQVSTPDNSSAADEIRKYKSLLDDGIITQEEFDAKKKQLLGL